MTSGVIRARGALRALLVLGMGALSFLPPPVTASFEEALERATLLVEKESYREAREVLDPLLERDSSHPRILLLHGILRAREGNVGEAIEIFDRLRRDRPEMSEPWNNLAVLYAAQGRFDEARESLLASLERKPSTTGYTNLGDVYASLARHPCTRSREFGRNGSATPAPGGRERGTPSGPGSPAERPAAGGPAGGTGTASATTASAEPACLCAGGFEGRGDLAEARRWLESRGAEVFGVPRTETREVSRHRVYLPPLEDRAEAAEKVRELDARGVRDVAVIGSGPLANGISFGVFGIVENMQRRVAALERLGYPVLSRHEVETVHRFLAEVRSEEDPAGLVAAWVERFPGLSLEPVDCG